MRYAKSMRIVAYNLFVVTAFVWIFRFDVSTESVDLSLHYQLVHFLYEMGRLPSWSGMSEGSQTASLGIMAPYPPLAHALAAVVGRLVGSAFLGMAWTAAGSVLVIYLVLCHTVAREDRLVALMGFSTLVIGFGSNIPLHGWEILQNYFFAQVVCSAAMYLCLYISVVHLRGWTAIGFSVLCTLVMSFTYLMSGFIYSAAFVASLTIGLGTSAYWNRKLTRARLIQLVSSIVILMLINLLSPELQFMRLVSANDGGFHPDLLVMSVCVLAVMLLLGGGLIGLTQFLRSSTSGVFIASLSLGISAVFLLQLIAYGVFNVGSAYALKKYTFDISTMLALCIAYLANIVVDRISSYRIWPISADLRSIVSCLVAFGLAFRVLSSVSPYDIRRFVGFDAYVQRAMAQELPKNALGSTISMVEGLVPSVPLQLVLNFATNVTQLGMPADVAGALYLGKEPEKGARPIHYAFVSKDSGLAGIDACRIDARSLEIAVLIDYECATRDNSFVTLNSVVKPRGPLKPPYLLEGWSQPGPGGVWSDATRAVLRIRMKRGRPASDLTLRLSMYGFVTEQHPEQHVAIHAEGVPLADRTYRFGQPVEPLAVKLPAGLFQPDGTIDVTLDLPNAMSPKAMGLGVDPRPIAVGLTSFEVDE